MKRLSRSLALGATLLAAGCGQKGPLYLPDKSATVITAAPAQPAPAESPPAEAAPASPAPAPGAAPPSGTAPKPEDKNHDSESPK